MKNLKYYHWIFTLSIFATLAAWSIVLIYNINKTEPTKPTKQTEISYKIESNIIKIDTTKVDSKTLWIKNCKQCHGERGTGNGVKARIFQFCPYNLANETKTDSNIYYIVLNGQNLMLEHKNKLQKNEIWVLVVHIKTFKEIK